MLGPETWTVVLCAVAIGIAVWRNAAAIREALDNFRGGPPTPMHPSPAGDDELLRRRRAKKRD